MDIYHFQITEENHEYLAKYLIKFHGFSKQDYSFLPEIIEKGIYQKVATVATTDLDKAFELTNHIDSDWTLNPEVIAYNRKNKSSCVGDIFVLNNKAYIVESTGFGNLDETITKKLISPKTQKKLKM